MGCTGAKMSYNPRAVDITHFKEERTMGKGGFGVVKAVRKLSPPDEGAWYALKSLDKSSLAEDLESMKEVLTELERLKTLGQHPNVCNLFYAFDGKTHVYVVLNLLQGGDLRFHLASSFKSEEKRLRKIGSSGGVLRLSSDISDLAEETPTPRRPSLKKGEMSVDSRFVLPEDLCKWVAASVASALAHCHEHR